MRNEKPVFTEILTHDQWVTAIYEYVVVNRSVAPGSYNIDVTINVDKSMEVRLCKKEK